MDSLNGQVDSNYISVSIGQRMKHEALSIAAPSLESKLDLPRGELLPRGRASRVKVPPHVHVADISACLAMGF